MISLKALPINWASFRSESNVYNSAEDERRQFVLLSVY